MRKRKKVVKMRGSKTHGYGAKKKHRGKGSKGGKGYAGSFKHKKMMMLKYEPERIKRKKGTTGPKRKKEIKCINLYEIEKIAQGKEIDVTKMGYQKVLGRGEI
ncbi:MAG TPA: 50S ribosomal protein L15, partial [Candidatus Aenigmarchaeota archaeon]|nr:50S ribosomal protein L15 [Candidatus Aenigmarchaeota archaeon]